MRKPIHEKHEKHHVKRPLGHASLRIDCAWGRPINGVSSGPSFVSRNNGDSGASNLDSTGNRER
eukprot:scaffold264745_cov36-Prasinocladus_malaysianus.AAC.1